MSPGFQMLDELDSNPVRGFEVDNPVRQLIGLCTVQPANRAPTAFFGVAADEVARRIAPGIGVRRELHAQRLEIVNDLVEIQRPPRQVIDRVSLAGGMGNSEKTAAP